MIITIARKCGCDADSIGRAVAEKYHLHFMDREAIAAGAKEAGCYDEYEEFYSERPVNSLLYSIVMETEEDNVLHDTPAMALTFIDRLPLEDGCEGYVFLKIKIQCWKNHILSLVDFQKKFIYY